MFWPGEDTKLCLDLIKKTGKKILYVPEMVVWHHRRAGLLAHLKQIGGYGLHRGYFAKRFPETSLRITYFVPSLFLIFACISLFYPTLPEILQVVIKVGWILYVAGLIMAVKDMLKFEKATVSSVALVYVFFTHLYYGLRFIQGLLTPQLVSKLR